MGVILQILKKLIGNSHFRPSQKNIFDVFKIIVELSHHICFFRGCKKWYKSMDHWIAQNYKIKPVRKLNTIYAKKWHLCRSSKWTYLLNENKAVPQKFGTEVKINVFLWIVLLIVEIVSDLSCLQCWLQVCMYMFWAPAQKYVVFCVKFYNIICSRCVKNALNLGKYC